MRIACIVEGHGEVGALGVLLRRFGTQLDPPLVIDVPPPIRLPRGKFLNRECERERTLKLAALKAEKGGAVLILYDADTDCANQLVGRLQPAIDAVIGHRLRALVFAVQEYEAWFLASASSLAGKRGLPVDLGDHPHPEVVKDAKGWLSARMKNGRKYKETLDQPAMSAQFDISVAQKQSPSFDKFIRELTRLVSAPPSAPDAADESEAVQISESGGDVIAPDE